MKIAVSASGSNIEGDLNPMFGRCQYFLIIDIENDKIRNIESIENIAAKQSGAAGIFAAQAVAEKDVKAVITGNMGPRAFDVMCQFGIEVYTASGKIKDAVEKYIKGKLERIKGPGQMHYGLGQGGTSRSKRRGFK